jgi:hypothetical protein
MPTLLIVEVGGTGFKWSMLSDITNYNSAAYTGIYSEPDESTVHHLRPCVTFSNLLVLFKARSCCLPSKPKVGGLHLWVVCDCLFNISTAILRLVTTA